MKRNIVIAGGGISGLSLLHYLKRQFAKQPEVSIQLLEKGDFAGGTVKTQEGSGFLFETGPNGFLNNQPETIEFIRQIGLADQMIAANPAAQKRFLSLHHTLHALPHNPLDLISFKPLNPADKFRISIEPFVPKSTNVQESVYEFGVRRFGAQATELLLDPMVTGVFAGDIKKLHLQSAFPKIFQWEQQFGSIVKGLVESAKKQGKESKGLHSMRQGMGQVIRKLHETYKDAVFTKQDVISVNWDRDHYLIHTNRMRYRADELILSVPAYEAAEILVDINADLSQDLNRIEYSPVAVVGLAYNRSQFFQPPEGFGYLIPSKEKNPVLGVLFESNIFEGRAPKDQMLIRVLIGGAHHPGAVKRSAHELIDMANQEIWRVFKFNGKPKDTFFAVWPKGIPQYNIDYPEIRSRIERGLKNHTGLHLAGNYLDGVSFNDCIRNAKIRAEKIHA